MIIPTRARGEGPRSYGRYDLATVMDAVPMIVMERLESLVHARSATGKAQAAVLDDALYQPQGRTIAQVQVDAPMTIDATALTRRHHRLASAWPVVQAHSPTIVGQCQLEVQRRKRYRPYATPTVTPVGWSMLADEGPRHNASLGSDARPPNAKG